MIGSHSGERVPNTGTAITFDVYLTTLVPQTDSEPCEPQDIQIAAVRLHYSISTSSCIATINNLRPHVLLQQSLKNVRISFLEDFSFSRRSIRSHDNPSPLGCFQRRTCEPLFTTTIFSSDRTVHPSFPVLVIPFPQLFRVRFVRFMCVSDGGLVNVSVNS